MQRIFSQPDSHHTYIRVSLVLYRDIYEICYILLYNVVLSQM